MSYQTLVWAFKPIKELNNQTGMVECDSDLAAKLIKADKAQDMKVGALHFKEIEKAKVKKVVTKKDTKTKAKTKSKK